MNLRSRLQRLIPVVMAAFLAVPLLVVSAGPQEPPPQAWEPPSMAEWEYRNTPMARAIREADPTAYQFTRALFSVTERARRNREALREAVRQGRLSRAATAAAVSAAAMADTAVSGTFRFPVIVGAFAAPDSARPFDLGLLNDRLWTPDYVDPDGKHDHGSVHDYYQEVSYGRLDLTGDIYGYVQADSSVGYYVDQSGDEQPGFMDWLDQMIATVDTGATGIDFSQYDGDHDGYVDTLVLVHNLVGAESGSVYGGTTGFWSHRWTYKGADYWVGGNSSPQPYYTDDDDPYAPANGNPDGVIKINDYVMQPLLNRDLSLIDIGVFAHELGHAFGLPDFYDIDGPNSGGDSEGLGHWCLMASGSWRNSYSPAHMGAIAKTMLGWITPLEITDVDTTGLKMARSEDNEFAVKVHTSQMHPEEYFLIENRQAVGFDEFLHGTGLLIYHVNDQVTTLNKNPNDLQWAIEQADGLFDLEHNTDRGDGGDPWPGGTANMEFNAISAPTSETRAGLDSYVLVRLQDASMDSMRIDIIATPSFLLSDPGGGAYVADLTPVLSWDAFSLPAGWGALQYEVQVDTVPIFVSPALDTSAVNSLEWTGALVENDFYFWRVRAFDDLGNSRFNAGSYESFIVDISPPDLSIGALRNPVVTDQVDLYVVASEDLTSCELTVDAVPQTLESVSATGAYIRAADLTLSGPGTLALHAEGTDGAGHTATADATLAVTSLSALTGGVVTSDDGGFSLVIPSGAIRRDGLGLLLSSTEAEEAGALFARAGSQSVATVPSEGRALSPLYWVDVPGLVAGRNMLLTMRWQPGDLDAGEMPEIWRLGEGGWSRTECAVDLSAGEVVATVPEGGTYQLRAGNGGLQMQDLRLDLEPNFPNPFNPSTRIAFTLPSPGRVKLTVLNVRGQTVKVLVGGTLPAGRHAVTWDGRDAAGRDVASGIYFYVLDTPSGMRSRKMTLIR